MKKKQWYSVLLVLVMLLSMLAGCSDCDHQWEEANCRDPKTCKLCNATRGEPNEEHQWEAATTDEPMTCRLCGLTEGEALDVDERFTTDACKDLFGNWSVKYKTNDPRLGMENLVLNMQMTMIFHNDGDLVIRVQLQNVAEVEEALAQLMTQKMYEQYRDDGKNREQADAASKAEYGVGVAEFCEIRAKQIVKALDKTDNKVYYVEDGLLYTGTDWGDDMTAQTFELTEDGKLTLENSELGQTLEFRRTAGE